MPPTTFKQEHALDKRMQVSKRIREKYSDRIPVIVEKAAKSDVPDIDKKKYLVPSDITVGKFVYEIRKHMKLSPEKAIFLFVGNGVLPPTAALMSQIYDRFKDEDGFLYIVYSVATEQVTLSIIASPLASSKLKTQLLALVKAAAEAKQLRRGLKEVTKALRKNEKGLVVIGGDVSPVDVLTHIPILCEDNDIPYVYVPSRSELGQSAQTKRATTLVLVRAPPAGASYAKEYESLSKTVHNLKATVM